MTPGKALSLLFCALCSQPGWAQTCGAPGIAGNGAEQRFQPRSDGTLTDTVNRLRWQRCAVGQQWREASCEGTPRRLTLAEARRQGSNGWRLPTLPELSAIVDLRCSRPAIDGKWFPNTPAAAFWTSTVFASDRGTAPRYWQVQFLYGESSLGNHGDHAHLRLVRDER